VNGQDLTVCEIVEICAVNLEPSDHGLMASGGAVQSLGKNYRVRNSCARVCENIELPKFFYILSGLTGYWVGPNIKKISIEPG
jgi:hypothetical protein